MSIRIALAVLCVACVLPMSAFAVSDVDTHLAELRDAGIAAEQNKEYAKAIESYRQVLYVNGNDARSQFGLAYALEQTGKLDAAEREFKRFDAVVRRDDRLTREETQQYTAYTREALVRLTGQRKGVDRSFMAIDILVITGALWLVWLYKGVRCVQMWRQEKREDNDLGDICLDSAWMQKRDKEVDRPVNWITLAIIALTLFFSVMSVKIAFFS